MQRYLGNLGLQSSSSGSETSSPSAVPSVVQAVVRSPGELLDTATRTSMEARFDADFSHVRVHTDAQASESAKTLLSHAYTLGQHVVFAPGRYAPGTSEGRRLLGHELAHVKQQDLGARGRSSVSNAEIEADMAGKAAVSGRAASVGAAVAPGIQREPLSEKELEEIKRIHSELELTIDPAQRAQLQQRLVELAGKQANATMAQAHPAPQNEGSRADVPAASAASERPFASKKPRPPAQAHPTPRPANAKTSNLFFEGWPESSPDLDVLARQIEAMRQSDKQAALERQIADEKQHARGLFPERKKDGWSLHPEDLPTPDVERLLRRIRKEPNIPPAKPGERTRPIMFGNVVIAPANTEGERRTWVVNLTADFKRVREDADQRRYAANDFLEHWKLLRQSADWMASATPPNPAVWIKPTLLCDKGERAIEQGNLEEAFELLQQANQELSTAKEEWYRYTERNIEGAERIKTGLEHTKNAADLTLTVLAIYASGGGALALRGVAAGTPKAFQIARTFERIATWTPVAEVLAESGARALSGDKVEWQTIPLNILTSVISSKLKLGNRLGAGIFDRLLKSGLAKEFETAALQRFITSVVNQSGDMFIRNLLEGLYKKGLNVSLDEVLEQTWAQLTDPTGALSTLIIAGMHAKYPPMKPTPTLAKEKPAPAKGTLKKTTPAPLETRRLTAPAAKETSAPAGGGQGGEKTAAAPVSPGKATKPLGPFTRLALAEEKGVSDVDMGRIWVSEHPELSQLKAGLAEHGVEMIEDSSITTRATANITYLKVVGPDGESFARSVVRYGPRAPLADLWHELNHLLDYQSGKIPPAYTIKAHDAAHFDTLRASSPKELLAAGRAAGPKVSAMSMVEKGEVTVRRAVAEMRNHLRDIDERSTIKRSSGLLDNSIDAVLRFHENLEALAEMGRVPGLDESGRLSLKAYMRKYVDTNFPELPDVYESYFPKKPKFWHFLNEEKSGSPAAEPASKPLSIPGDTLSPVKTIGQPAKEPAMTFVVRQPAEMLYNPLALVRQQAALEGAAKPGAAPPEAAPPVEKPSAGVQREAPATQQEALGRRYVDEAVQRERFSTQYVERRGAAEWELMQHLPEEKRRAIEAELKSLDEWFDQESDTGVETPRAAPGNEAEAAGRQFVDRALRENRVSSEYTTRWSMLDTELLQMMPEERRRAIKAEQEAVGRWYDDEQAREAIKGTTAHRESPGTADEARGREIAELIERKNEVSAYYTSRWSYLDSLLLQMMPEERRKTIKAEQEALGKWFDDETDGNKEAAGPHNSEAVNREQKLRYYAERKRILQRELLIEIPDEKRFAIEAEATALERWFDAQGFGEREAIEADALRFSATGNPGFSSHRVFRKF